MDKNKIKILYKEIEKEPRIMEIEDKLEIMQELVDGLIEIIPYNDVLIVCNDEGKLLNMKPNILFDYDYIAGNCFFVGDDYKNAGFKSLTDEQIKAIKEMLKEKSFKNTSLDNEMEL